MHILPAETFGSNHDRLVHELPDPPGFKINGDTEQFGTYAVTGDTREDALTSYTCFHEEGWIEAATIHITALTDDKHLGRYIDQDLVKYIEEVLDWYEEVGINPPFYTYLTLFHADGFHFYVDPRDVLSIPNTRRRINTDRFEFGEVRIDSYDADVPSELQKPMFRLWG